jgi:hypothetical protein
MPLAALFTIVTMFLSTAHRYRKAKIDCLRFVMCPLLAQLEIGFFSSFSAAAVYSTNEANKAGLKQSIIFRCLWYGPLILNKFVVKTSYDILTINLILRTQDFEFTS